MSEFWHHFFIIFQPSYAPVPTNTSSSLQPPGNLTPLPPNALGASNVVAGQQSIIVMQNPLKTTNTGVQQVLVQPSSSVIGKPSTSQGGLTMIKQTSTPSAATPFLSNLEPLPPSAVQVRTTRPQLPTQPLPPSVVVSQPARIVQLPTQPIPQSRVSPNTYLARNSHLSPTLILSRLYRCSRQEPLKLWLSVNRGERCYNLKI